MTFPILVEQHNGQFRAKLVGEATVSVVGATREAAVASLKAELARRVACGELALVDIADVGVLSLAGKYADDHSLREICDQVYAHRDQERERLNQ